MSVANKSILRVDLFVYYRRFGPTKTLRGYSNILAYYLQVGLLDIAKTRPQVLIYELTKTTEEEKLYEASKNLQARAKSMECLYHAFSLLSKLTSGKPIAVTDRDTFLLLFREVA